MKKRLFWGMVCLAVAVSCREDVVQRITKPSGAVDPFAKFEALTFKTFDELRAAGNLGADFDATSHKLTPSSTFTSLYSAYQDARAFERTWKKTEPTLDRFNSYVTMVKTFSPRVDISPDKGIYLKIFNPGFARMINKYGLVIIGGDLYFFDEDAFVRIPRKEVLKWNIANIDLSNIKSLIDASKAVPYPVTSKKTGINNRTDAHSDCATQMLPQEEGIWGNAFQRVIGCVTIDQYSSPFYQQQYVCNYGGGGEEIPIDGDGNPMYCSWQDVYMYDQPYAYDARAEYFGREDLVIIVPVATNAYDLTMMKMDVYVGPAGSPSLVASTTTTDGSYVGWFSFVWFTTSMTGIVQSRVYIQDSNSWAFYQYPTTPAIVNTVAFF
jgi:hypothetical protein